KSFKPVARMPEDFPSQLRGVRIVRDGKLISEASAHGTPQIDVETLPASGRYARDPAEDVRDIHVGDRVRLLSFGSTGIVDQIRGDEAEVRVGSLRMREKLANLEPIGPATDNRHEVSTSRGSGRVNPSLESLKKQAATTELH